MSGSRSLLAIGDMLPARTPLGERSADGFGEVCERIRSAGVAVGTLDSTLTRRGVPAEKLVTLRADPALAGELRESGFDVISLANNHAMDYGEPGLVDTLEALTDAGIACVGAGTDLEAATAPVAAGTADWRVGVLAWSSLLPTGSAADEARPGVAPLHVHVSYELDPYVQMEEPTYPPTIRSRVDGGDLAAATAAIESACEQFDFVVVLVHWGVGDSNELSEYQRPLAHALVDAGADLVIGSHPHCVCGVEVHQGKAILYSAGTLIDQMPREGLAPDLLAFTERMSPDAFLATAEFGPDGSYELTLLPVTQQAYGMPTIARDAAFERIAERLARLSFELDTRVEVHGSELAVIGAGVAAASAR